MSLGPPPVLELGRDELGALIRSETSRRPPVERRAATMTREGETAIFGYFTGRPSAKTLRPLFQRILEGKARALGGYKADGKDVVISLPGR